MPTALVRHPGPKLADGLVTDAEPVPVDVDEARLEWHGYVEALIAHGWDVVEVDPADDCPDAVFVEDALVVFDDLAVVTRPGAPSRRAETAGAEATARELGLGLARIEPPATLDGGDVLKVGRTVYVGVTARTDRAAVDQLQIILADRDWTVLPVPVSRVLHLKSAVTALPDGTVIGHPDVVDDPSVFDPFVPVPEPAGAHVVLLGPGEDGRERLLMATGAPESAALFRASGYEPVEVDISEFEKLDGCVTCLSVRIRD